MRIDLPELRVGTMLIKDGTTTKIPHLPDMKVRGNAWVLESTPTKLRIYEKDTAWGFIPMTFNQTLQLNPDNTLNFTLQSTAFGLPLPTLHKQYELTNTRRGYLELKTLDAKNPFTGYISAQDGWFEIDLPGPLGSHDKKRIPIIQPSDSRYKPRPLATAAK